VHIVHCEASYRDSSDRCEAINENGVVSDPDVEMLTPDISARIVERNERPALMIDYMGRV
jgi:hypothetical protein